MINYIFTSQGVLNKNTIAMDFKRDLLKVTKKSKFRVIVGVLFLAIAILWITTRFIDNELIRRFDWLYTVLFGLNGVVHILGGMGFSFERLLGKAFIEIDSKSINMKLGAFEKEHKINWQDIKSINYKPNVFKISQLDDKIQLIKISKLDFLSISEIKEVISKIAADKNVSYSIV